MHTQPIGIGKGGTGERERKRGLIRDARIKMSSCLTHYSTTQPSSLSESAAEARRSAATGGDELDALLDALKGKNRKVWASVRVELGKDRPEPSLNRFFVDAVDEASAPESIADDLIDMAAALFPGQDFTA